MIDINARCPPLADDIKPALLPGELNAMFERIVEMAPGNQTADYEIEENMTNYSVVVHSRPEPFEGEPSRERDMEQPPWIITFEDFLTKEECEHLIKMGHNAKYERSKDGKHSLF
jgi:prolyl 4-hydroxylase